MPGFVPYAQRTTWPLCGHTAWITPRGGSCWRCGELVKGATALWYGNERVVVCAACGELDLMKGIKPSSLVAVALLNWRRVQELNLF